MFYRQFLMGTINIFNLLLYRRITVLCCIVSLVMLPLQQAIAFKTSIEYYHYDHQGSLLEVYDGATNKRLLSQAWSPWGERQVLHAAVPRGNNSEGQLFAHGLPAHMGYTGHKQLQATALIFAGDTRLYDARLKRFLNSDDRTTGGVRGQNRYSYAYNNPMAFIDPDGRRSVSNVEDRVQAYVYIMASITIQRVGRGLLARQSVNARRIGSASTSARTLGILSGFTGLTLAMAAINSDSPMTRLTFAMPFIAASTYHPFANVNFVLSNHGNIADVSSYINPHMSYYGNVLRIIPLLALGSFRNPLAVNIPKAVFSGAALVPMTVFADNIFINQQQSFLSKRGIPLRHKNIKDLAIFLATYSSLLVASMYVSNSMVSKALGLHYDYDARVNAISSISYPLLLLPRQINIAHHNGFEWHHSHFNAANIFGVTAVVCVACAIVF